MKQEIRDYITSIYGDVQISEVMFVTPLEELPYNELVKKSYLAHENHVRSCQHNNRLAVENNKLSKLCTDLLEALESSKKLDTNELDETIKQCKEKVVNVFWEKN